MRRPSLGMHVGLVRMNRHAAPVLYLRKMSDLVRVPSRSRSVRDPVRWSDRVGVRRPDVVRCPGAMNLVAARVVAVMSRAMVARKAQERHRGHAGGAQDQAENEE